jgi:hypothetical protein
MSKNGTAFAPGTSPFHAKGMLWLGIRDFIEEIVPGGVSALASSLDAPHAAFVTQLFVGVGWYDLLPINAVATAAASLLRVDRMEYVRRTGVWQAKRDMAGVYKALLTSDAPATVCRRFASIYAQLYDFGKVQVVRDEPNRIETQLEGMPEPIAWWWKRGTECYIDQVLLGAGARSPKIAYSPFKPDGSRGGVQLIKMTSITTWA